MSGAVQDDPIDSIFAVGCCCDGRYVVGAPLADGLLGSVFAAEDQVTGALVALKVVAPIPPGESVMRARREAELMSCVDHPLVARAHGAGEHEGLGYIAMQYVPGEDLCTFINRRVLEDDPISLERAMGIIAQLCEALDAVHAAGLLHRDVKPANVMVTPDERITLIDFGAAQRCDEAFGLWGTPLYIAPEISLQRVVPPALRSLCDVFALGVTIFELLSGEEPFVLDAEADLADQLLAQAKQTPRWLGELRPDLPEAVSHLLRAAMSARLEQRPRTPHALFRALHRTLPRSARRTLVPPLRQARPTVPLRLSA